PWRFGVIQVPQLHIDGRRPAPDVQVVEAFEVSANDYEQGLGDGGSSEHRIIAAQRLPQGTCDLKNSRYRIHKSPCLRQDDTRESACGPYDKRSMASAVLDGQ